MMSFGNIIIIKIKSIVACDTNLIKVVSRMHMYCIYTHTCSSD